MNKKDFLIKAKETIEKENQIQLKHFIEFADNALQIFQSDKKYYNQIYSDLLRDFEGLNVDGPEDSAWYVKGDFHFDDLIVTKEVRKLLPSAAGFFNLEEIKEVEGYLVTVKVLEISSGNYTTMSRSINMNGSFKDMFERYNYSFESNEEGFYNIFKYYVKPIEKNIGYNTKLTELVDSMLFSLGLSTEWKLDYLSLSEKRDYILIKKHYQNEGTDLSLSITKEKDKRQVVEFFTKDKDVKEQVNAILCNHDLDEIQEISDLVDLNYRY